jgi:hypothetical protein
MNLDTLLLLTLNLAQLALVALVARRLGALYRLQAVTLRPIHAEHQRAVLRLLVESGLFATPARRRLLLLDLPPALVASLDGDGSTTGDLTTLVTSAARWSGPAFHQLLDNAALALNGSDAGRALRRLRADWQL